MKVIVIFAIIFLHKITHAEEDDMNTLKLVHIVFRHGNRGPDVYQGNCMKKPLVEGQLTEIGEKNSYLLGEWLQQRYGQFLGRYSTELVETASTYFKRTKDTLELVMKGLFSSPNDVPSSKECEFTYRGLLPNNSLFVVMHPECVHFNTLYQNFKFTEAYKKIVRKYTNLNRYIITNMNISFTTLDEFMLLYLDWSMKKENGISLPKWAEILFPKINSTLLDFFRTTLGTKELKRVTIGGFIKNLIKKSSLKFKNKLQPQGRKLFLYSGHDINVYWTLKLFNYVFKAQPPYNSCVMIEAHTINNVDGFKVFYKHGKEEVRAVNIPNCGLFCPLTRFVEMYEEYYPTFDTC